MATRAGWLDGHEVTEVWFDPAALSFAELLAAGREHDCARLAWTTTNAQFELARTKLGDGAKRLTTEPRADREPKYYLLQTPYRHVPMTAAQAARCNAALAPGAKVDAKRWLSPRQLRLLERIAADGEREWPVAIGQPIADAWARLER
ncbi:MAG: hypothetical protein KDE27_31535 [Planctomycetes bacterium]|nr:hypothetical protein [Planctomycetota bacterium]